MYVMFFFTAYRVFKWFCKPPNFISDMSYVKYIQSHFLSMLALVLFEYCSIFNNLNGLALRTPQPYFKFTMKSMAAFLANKEIWRPRKKFRHFIYPLDKKI
ncbi:Uncharacterized protein dnl_55555 [Desulfonema limicola]|uniref:Uncharacterized protein n=1 Tax=Desulfonema limicola TaxID=45656 RepID=A0A975BD08_9BACT|nr:Uncharacterized protein dnl_55555 [Desulfonema limicola]